MYIKKLAKPHTVHTQTRRLGRPPSGFRSFAATSTARDTPGSASVAGSVRSLSTSAAMSTASNLSVEEQAIAATIASPLWAFMSSATLASDMASTATISLPPEDGELVAALKVRLAGSPKVRSCFVWFAYACNSTLFDVAGSLHESSHTTA